MSFFQTASTDKIVASSLLSGFKKTGRRVGKVEKTCPSSEKKKSTKHFSKKAEIFHAQSLRFYSQRQSARALETRLIVLNKKKLSL